MDCILKPVAEIRRCVQKLNPDMYFPETCPADRVFSEIYKIKSKEFSISGVLKKTDRKNM